MLLRAAAHGAKPGAVHPRGKDLTWHETLDAEVPESGTRKRRRHEVSGYLTPSEQAALKRGAATWVTQEHKAESKSDDEFFAHMDVLMYEHTHPLDEDDDSPFTTDGPDSPLGYDGTTDDSSDWSWR